MAKLDEPQKERLRTLTVEVLLEVRAMYLATGASALKHWDQLQNRSLSAAKRSASPDEWTTLLMRGLQIGAPSSSLSSALLDLAATVREQSAAREWLDLLERELGLIMAMTRRSAEQRRERREALLAQGANVDLQPAEAK